MNLRSRMTTPLGQLPAGHTTDAFDRIASSFDQVVVRNPINAWMREVNSAILRATFAAGGHLLEMGCGTGTEAIDLARRGCSVFAFDLAPGMVAKAREKALAAQVTDRLTIVQGRTADLLAVVGQSPWRTFDGAYANFTLTYEDDLRALAVSLAAVLKHGARFVCTVPNRLVLSEVLLYVPLLRFPQVLWRFARPLRKDVHGVVLEIHAYSPWQVRDAFRESFNLERLVGVPTFLPPVYLHAQYRRLGAGHEVFEWLDARLAGRFPWNRLGEHTLFVFRRK